MFKNHGKSLNEHSSEASYLYISIGQKFIKNAQNGLLKLSVKQIYQSDILTLEFNSEVIFVFPGVDLKNIILISSKNSDLGFSIFST